MEEEFWWLSRLGLPITGKVGIALSLWTDPKCDSWFQEIDGLLIDIGSLADWAAQHQWVNVHRTLRVFSVPDTSSSFVVGPMVIDIDADEDLFDEAANPRESQMEEAKDIALAVVQYFTGKGAAQSDTRIYFSGHKGFHIELVFPNRPDMHHSGGYKLLWDVERRSLLRMLQSRGFSGRPDPFHDHVRLKTSINRRGPLGSESRHRVINLWC